MGPVFCMTTVTVPVSPCIKTGGSTATEVTAISAGPATTGETSRHTAMSRTGTSPV